MVSSNKSLLFEEGGRAVITNESSVKEGVREPLISGEWLLLPDLVERNPGNPATPGHLL